jgi:hypothetical protein
MIDYPFKISSHAEICVLFLLFCVVCFVFGILYLFDYSLSYLVALLLQQFSN